jgi:hypothetical protein
LRRDLIAQEGKTEFAALMIVNLCGKTLEKIRLGRNSLTAVKAPMPAFS